MKKGNKVLYVIAVAALAVLVGCGNKNNPTVNPPVSSEPVSEESSAPSVHTHTYGAWSWVKEPTETTAGEAKRVCAEDNTEEKVTVAALNDATVWSVKTEVAATHAAAGSKTYHNDDYGDVTVAVAKLAEHTYGAWTMVQEPTETAAGKAERVCSVDQEKDTKDIAVLTDTAEWSVKAETPATHAAAGSKTYTSANYGDVTVVIPALAEHTYGDWKLVTKPTEAAKGTAERVCDVEGNKETVDVAVLTDTTVWSCTVTKEATHAEVGSKTYHNDTYGDVVVEIAKLADHTYGDWTMVTKPTEDTAGKAERVCPVEGAKEDKDIAKLTDTTEWTLSAETPATHAAKGSRTYTSANYGDVVVVLPELAEHTYGAWKLTVDPTEEATGKAERACTVEGAKEEVTVAALTDETVWTKTSDVAPTHAAAGSKVYHNDTYGDVTVVVPALADHTYGEWKITVEPTETAAGKAERVCDVEGAKDEVDLPALSDDSVWEVIGEVAATHASEGYKIYSNVTYGQVQVTTPALAEHTYGEWTVTKVDLGAYATIERTCTFDGEVETITNAKAPTGVELSLETLEDLQGYFTVTMGSADTSCNFVEVEGGIKSNNKEKGSTVAYIKLVAEEATTFSFDYSGGGEAKYDYFSVHKNSEKYESTDALATTYGSTSASGHVSIELAEGDFVYITFRKDGSGNAGADSVTITNMKVVSTDAEIPADAEYGIAFLDTGFDDLTAKPRVVFKGQSLGELPTLEKEGYVFEGWTIDEEGTTQYTGQAIEGVTTIYAKWFDLANESVFSGEYKGFVIDGSYYNPSVTGGKTLSVNYRGYITDCSDTSYKGQTIADDGTFGSYKIVYDASIGGYFAYPQNMTTSSKIYVFFKDLANVMDSTYVKLASLESKKYFYVEVNDTKNNLQFNFFTNETADTVTSGVTLTAIDGTTVAYADINDNKTGVFSFKVTKGEDTLETFGLEDTTWKHVEDTSTLYGVYTIDAETTLYLNGLGYMKLSTTPTVKTKYTLAGTTDTYTFSATDSSTFYYEVTVDEAAKTAQLVDVKYTYTISVGDKVDAQEAVVKAKNTWVYESNLPKLTESTDGNYTFDGWYMDEACTNKFSTFRATESLTIYAKWVEKLTLTVNNNNGTDPVVTNFKSGYEPTLTTPTKAGYIFNGWFTDETLETPYVTGAKTESVTVYADWIEAPFYVGAFDGFNSDHSNVGLASNTCSYHVEITEAGKVTGKVTSTWTMGEYDAETKLLSIANGNKFYVDETANGIVFGYAYYGNLNFPSMSWDDFAIYVKSEGTTKATFKTFYWNNGYNKITQITLGEKVAYVYSDGETKTIYKDVTFTNFAGDAIAFDALYDSTANQQTPELIIKQGDTVITQLAATTETKYGYAKNDGKAGTYVGTIDGASSSVVLDGYGRASVTVAEAEAVAGTYTFADNVLTVVYGEKTVSFTVGEENALTQVLDGFEGTYTLGEQTFVITGYGVVTIDGAANTYEVLGDLIAITVGETTTYYGVNKEAGTIEVKELVSLDGKEFKGNTSYNYEATITFVGVNEVQIKNITYTVKTGTYIVKGNVVEITIDDHTDTFAYDADAGTLTGNSSNYKNYYGILNGTYTLTA